jgi:hypothetical protein
MAVTSTSSSSGVPTFAVWLWDATFTRVALVDVPVPLPNLVLYLGQYYVWSAIHWGYQAANPDRIPGAAFAVSGDLGAPQLSVLANPQQ